MGRLGEILRATAEACSRTVHRRALTTVGAAGKAIRAETAAVGDQPADISDFARGPDIPNVKADPVANSSPSRNWSRPEGVDTGSPLWPQSAW